MNKTTLKTLKRYIASGEAINATIGILPQVKERLAYSTGCYGMNGMLYKGMDNNIYAIIGRSSNLFTAA